MKTFNIVTLFKTLFTSIFLIAFAAACSNSASDDHEEHSDPEGFVLKMNGQNIVTQPPGGTLTGEIDLVVGEETDLITIYFLDHDGDEFQPEEDEYSLGYEFDPEDIAEFEQHPEDGRWSFHIHAEAEGVTNLQLMLKHGTHSDFTTQDIHIHVEAAE